MNATPEELTRLFKNSTRQDDCILYGGLKDRDGYGIFHFRRLNRRAHRVIYWHHYGDIPKDLVINHTCRNRACINVKHLELVTKSANSRKDSNSPAYRNSQKTHCPNGHPFDRAYNSARGVVRFCSICDAAKKKRLRLKWRAENKVAC